MRKRFCSQTTGAVVKTRFGVVFQMIKSLGKNRTPDLRWKVVWVYG